jgi:hypothetical protein
VSCDRMQSRIWSLAVSHMLHDVVLCCVCLWCVRTLATPVGSAPAPDTRATGRWLMRVMNSLQAYCRITGGQSSRQRVLQAVEGRGCQLLPTVTLCKLSRAWHGHVRRCFTF